MADRYLLESGGGDGFLLEDGSGVLLLDNTPPRYLLESGAPDGYLLENGSGVLILEGGIVGYGRVAWEAALISGTSDVDRARVAWATTLISSALIDSGRVAWMSTLTSMTSDVDRARVAWASTLISFTESFTCLPGLRVFHDGVVQELCIVDVSEAPVGMGGTIMVRKGATTLAAYLVETTDPEASAVRVNTSAGVKAIRKFT